MNKKLHVMNSNNFFAMGYHFCTSVLHQIRTRKESLKSDLLAGHYNDMIKHAGKYAGRQPSIHQENGLIKRVQEAKLSHFIRDVKSPGVQEFDSALKKAENLMSDDVVKVLDRNKLMKATFNVLRACKFPKYKFTRTSVELAANYQINKQSSASYPHYEKKGNVLEVLQVWANRVIRERWYEPFFWPLTRGFRLQLRPAENGRDIDLKVRVMYPYPGVLILLEDIFIIPFVRHFINTDTFYVIGRSGKEISSLIKKRFNHKDVRRITTTDITSFDQNVLNELIVCAFWILRSQLKLTKNDHDVFIEIIKYFCTSLAVSKVKGEPAYGFLKVKGVPSGSGFTNMIDTLVHAIALEYCIPDILSEDRTLICGDDNLFDSTGLDYKQFVLDMNEYCNLPISAEKSEHFNNWQKLKFLGFKWIQGVRYQNPYLLVNQTIWHSQFRTDLDQYDRELARGASVLLNARNGKDLFKLIFPDVVALLDSGVDVRFYYLYGTQPPSTLPGVLGYVRVKDKEILQPSVNAVLRDHLERGWMIR